MKKILITGSASPAALSFLKSFEEGQYQFYMADTDVYASGLYMVPKAQRVILKRGEDGLYIQNLHDQCKELGIDLLVPTQDEELLPISKSMKEFLDIDCKVLIASEKTLKLCEDKLNLLTETSSLFPDLQFVSYDTHIDVHNLSLPMAMKPRKASDSRLAEKIHSKTQLQTFKRDGSYFLQDYLPGQEYSVDVYRNGAGEVVACVPRARLKIQNDIVITGESRNSPDLVKLTTQIANMIDLFGVANIQFKEDANGHPVLMEVNARFPATMTLTVKSGANIPRLFVEEVLENKQIHELLPITEVAMTRCYQEIYFSPSEMIR